MATNSRAFLERYFAEVNDHLNDPSFSVRTTQERKLRMLLTQEAVIWERLLSAAEESVIGMAEAVITLENGKRFYPLPGNFRKWIKLEKRLDGDPNHVSAILKTKHVHNTDAGVILLTAQRGLEIDPVPVFSSNQDWTLIYQKGPIIHHYGRAKYVTSMSLTAGETSAGTLQRINNFYAGSMLKIFDADTGAPQIMEVISSQGAAGSFQFRHPLDMIPTGEVWYETIPALDEGLDSLYSYDVAMAIMATRKLTRQRQLLMSTRMELFSAAKDQFMSLTTDRGPERVLVEDPNEPSTGTEIWN